MIKKDYSKLGTLFRSMFILSACTFGGGFVIVSLMKKKFVEELKWLEEDEMLDVTAITESAPGPLPVNASVIIGCRSHFRRGDQSGRECFENEKSAVYCHDGHCIYRYVFSGYQRHGHYLYLLRYWTG